MTRYTPCPGCVDGEERPPFREAAGRRFFDMDFPRADCLSLRSEPVPGDRLPRRPLYVRLLPPAVQAAIGRVNGKTRGALKLPTGEGFVFPPRRNEGTPDLTPRRGRAPTG